MLQGGCPSNVTTLCPWIEILRREDTKLKMKDITSQMSLQLVPHLFHQGYSAASYWKKKVVVRSVIIHYLAQVGFVTSLGGLIKGVLEDPEVIIWASLSNLEQCTGDTLEGCFSCAVENRSSNFHGGILQNTANSSAQGVRGKHRFRAAVHRWNCGIERTWISVRNRTWIFRTWSWEIFGGKKKKKEPIR